jgi:Peptidase A4 family
MRSRIALVLTGISLVALLAVSGAQAARHRDRRRRRPSVSSGVIQLAKPRLPQLAATQSSNWFGYDQGALESGALFTEAGATWTVPSASPHEAGAEESSATWVGIGGGCVSEGCAISDPTGLIQTGTEQNVAADGSANYEAWWELVPLPSVAIEGVEVSPGDLVRASVAEVAPQELPQALQELPQTIDGIGMEKALSELGVSDAAIRALAKRASGGDTAAAALPGLGAEALPGLGIWRIALDDLTNGQSFSETVPYPSSHASAEWIEETPLAISTGGVGLTGLPDLTETPFEAATVNGKPARLSPSQAIDLVNESTVIGSVSEPSAADDGFGACAWSGACSLPSG